MKVDWKKKLTSRKFWAAAIGFGTTVVTVFNYSALTAEQVSLLGWALATLIAYILGEGLVDTFGKKGE